MKIAFDLIGAEPAPNGVKNHGGGEYVKTVFDYYYKNNANNDLSVIITGKDDNIISFLKNYKVTIFKCENSLEFQFVLNKEQFDSLFCGLYMHQYTNVLIPQKTKFILTEHGLRRIETKIDKVFLKAEKKKFKNIAKLILLNVFDKKFLKKDYVFELGIKDDMDIVTVSNHSKYSILSNFPNFKNIHVFYSPMKISKNEIDIELLKKFDLKKDKYFLLINANRGEKNCLRALMALEKLAVKGLLDKSFKVVLTGVTYNKPFNKFKHLNIVRLGYVETSMLETLYACAHLFIYPTINEGFGYPPLEAMKYNTLVATSAVTSVPEVCGNAVLYFNPYDVEEIENRILQSFDSDITNKVKANIEKQLKYINNMQDSGLESLKNIIDHK